MRYFAYGSNMSTPRLRHRLESVELIACASLPGHDLRFHKRGSDGSAKCDAFQINDNQHCILGVVFEIGTRDRGTLDHIEGVGVGYAAKQVMVKLDSGECLDALTYCATAIDDRLLPFHWYKHHVLAGAIEHGLPSDYVRHIEAVASIPDPDTRRHALEMAIY